MLPPHGRKYVFAESRGKIVMVSAGGSVLPPYNFLCYK